MPLILLAIGRRPIELPKIDVVPSGELLTSLMLAHNIEDPHIEETSSNIDNTRSLECSP